MQFFNQPLKTNFMRSKLYLAGVFCLVTFFAFSQTVPFPTHTDNDNNRSAGHSYAPLGIRPAAHSPQRGGSLEFQF
jgi:hypothetical protein